MAVDDVDLYHGLIADQAALEHFSQQPANQRKLTDDLKGVLAETACTGVVRYDWPLIRDLLVQQLDEQLAAYEAAERVDVGPARPLGTGDGDVQATVKRFTALLEQFHGPPWTLQRLCELLLEPRKQYQRLHKLVLAVEKLLLVTGEIGLTQSPPPLPRIDQLSRVNDPPAAAPASDASGATGHKRPRPEDADATGLVNAALTIAGEPESQSQAADGQSNSAVQASAALDGTKNAVEAEPKAADAVRHEQTLPEGQQDAACADVKTTAAMETDPQQRQAEDSTQPQQQLP